MKVLIGCETSGTVRDAFLRMGHDAWSCDILPSDRPTNRHIQDDIRNVMKGDWDLLAVMHPPCTRLCNSGVRWLHKAPPNRTLADMWRELDEGAELFSNVWNVGHIPMVAVENPVMHKLPPSADRWKLRSKFYQGIADAMAIQWGALA